MVETQTGLKRQWKNSYYYLKILKIVIIKKKLFQKLTSFIYLLFITRVYFSLKTA